MLVVNPQLSVAIIGVDHVSNPTLMHDLDDPIIEN